MAKNLVKDDGRYHSLVAPVGGVVSGQGYNIGDSLFVVALNTAAAGEQFTGDTKGVWELDKDNADSWSEGDQVFWDDTAKECIDTSGAGLKDIGVAVGGELGAGTGKLHVRLNGVGQLNV